MFGESCQYSICVFIIRIIFIQIKMFFKQASEIVKICSVCLVNKHKKKILSQKNEIKVFISPLQQERKIGRKNSTSPLQLDHKNKEN